MKKNNYWAVRMAEAAQKSTNKTISATNKQLAKYYRSCQERVINDFISLYNELLAQTKNGVKPIPADLYKLDKYWQLQGQLQNELTKLGDKSTKAMSKWFEKEFVKAYEDFALPGGDNFTTLVEPNAKQMINQIWCADGKSWSDRVWNNTAELQSTLNEQLIHCVTTGKKTSQLKAALQERFGVSYHQAETLVRTEMAHIETQAALSRYRDYGINEIEILADDSCSDCGKYDGKRFPINENPVPFHPNCRCCVLPVVKEVKSNDTN